MRCRRARYRGTYPLQPKTHLICLMAQHSKRCRILMRTVRWRGRSMNCGCPGYINKLGMLSTLFMNRPRRIWFKWGQQPHEFKKTRRITTCYVTYVVSLPSNGVSLRGRCFLGFAALDARPGCQMRKSGRWNNTSRGQSCRRALKAVVL